MRSVWGKGNDGLGGEKQALLLFNIELHFIEAGPISDSFKLVLNTGVGAPWNEEIGIIGTG